MGPLGRSVSIFNGTYDKSIVKQSFPIVLSKFRLEIELKTGHRISISRFLRLHPSLYLFAVQNACCNISGSYVPRCSKLVSKRVHLLYVPSDAPIASLRACRVTHMCARLLGSTVYRRTTTSANACKYSSQGFVRSVFML